MIFYKVKKTGEMGRLFMRIGDLVTLSMPSDKYVFPIQKTFCIKDIQQVKRLPKIKPIQEEDEDKPLF